MEEQSPVRVGNEDDYPKVPRRAPSWEHPRSRSPENPFAHSANVTISVPESVEVRLVDASTLSDYEVWFFFASLLGSTWMAFFVACLQAPPTQRDIFIIIDIVFLLLFVFALGMTLSKRHKIKARTRQVRYRVGDQVQDEGFQ